MYGFGDSWDPIESSVDLMNELVTEYVTGMVSCAHSTAALAHLISACRCYSLQARKAMEIGALRGLEGGKQLDNRSLIFTIQKDPDRTRARRKYFRIKRLHEMHEQVQELNKVDLS